MIYDEAIKTLNTFRNAYYNYTEDEEKKNVAQALDVVLPYNKKVEKELEEYKISDKSKEESSIEYYNLYKETKRKLKKVEELLGLYQSRFSFYNFDEDKELREIKQKEKELEAIK